MQQSSKNPGFPTFEPSLVWNNTPFNNFNEFHDKKSPKGLYSGISMGMLPTNPTMNQYNFSDAEFTEYFPQVNFRKRSNDAKKLLVCPFCFKSTIMTKLVIQDIEISLNCGKLYEESLNFIFYYHSDCFKENFLLDFKTIQGIQVARFQNFEDKIKFTEVNNPETEDLIEFQFYHPISKFKFIKVLKNSLKMQKNENYFEYLHDFKESDVLFDVGSLIVPLNFFRLSVRLLGYENKKNSRELNAFVYIPDSFNDNKIKFTMINRDFKLKIYGKIVEFDEGSFKETKHKILNDFLENNKLKENLFGLQIIRIKATVGERPNICSIVDAHDPEIFSNSINRSMKVVNRKSNKKTSIIETGSFDMIDEGDDSDSEESKKNTKNFSQPVIPYSEGNYSYNNENEKENSQKKDKSFSDTSKIQSNSDKNEINEENSNDEFKFQGKVFAMAKKQQGSRTLQKFIENGSQEDILAIFEEIKDCFPIILKDDYANYMFQVLCKRCTPELRLEIIKKIFPKIPSIARHKKGTHSLQSFVSIINTEEEQLLIVESVLDELIDLTNNLNGTHFIQKLILSFDSSSIIKILNAVIQNFTSIAMDQHGVCAVKILIEKYVSDGNFEKKLIVDTIVKHFDFLVQDPYANYSIKHCLEKYEYRDIFRLIVKITEKLLNLSLQKFSSFVVERCIILYYHKMREALLYLMDENLVSELSNNNYGSHVLKTIVQCIAGYDKIELMKVGRVIYSISTNCHNPNQKSFLQRLLSYIEKV